jgi:hypothetical protein
MWPRHDAASKTQTATAETAKTATATATARNGGGAFCCWNHGQPDTSRLNGSSDSPTCRVRRPVSAGRRKGLSVAGRILPRPCGPSARSLLQQKISVVILAVDVHAEPG